MVADAFFTETLYRTATRQMLEAAQLKLGDQVLDIAAGTGDQSRLAARVGGSARSVLATDISQEMLDVAARLAEREGVSNLTTRAMNAEQLDFPEKLNPGKKRLIRRSDLPWEPLSFPGGVCRASAKIRGFVGRGPAGGR